MIIDARTLPDGSQFEADLAIIGGGPAGIAIARAFAGTRFEVCLVESGGLAHDPEVQDLCAGETVGIPYSLTANRLRYFGGSTNHWGGYCRALDPIDFEPRDWVPHSGWPISRRDLDPYLGGACEVAEIAPARFEDKAYWSERTGEAPLAWTGGRIQERYFQFSPPTRFGQRYRADLEQAANVRVLLGANVMRIAAVPSARAVSHLDIRTLTGLNHRVRARFHVLATGGLENPRLLLLSNDVMANGLGNQNDLVGRFFMEHPHLGGFAELVSGDIARLPRIYRESLVVDGRPAKAAFVPDPQFLRRNRLLSASFTMSVAGQYRDTQDIEPDERAGAHRTMLRAARGFLTGDTAIPPGGDEGVWLGIGCACEQVPNPDSRVTLGEARDALGQRRIRLDWRLTEQDRRSLVANIRALGTDLAALGIGRMLMQIDDDGQWPEIVAGGSHHMGTTRMSDDPKQGVVDRHCRVHGIDNLYVAGSSVFATSGSANPTINILALAYRLVDHLEERLA